MNEYAIRLLNEAIADLSLRCEPSHNARTQFTVDDNKAKMVQLQAAVDALKQQPATHGEPVAWMTPLGNVFAGYQLTQEVKKDLCPLYTAPQPTPELMQAARQALEALNGYRRVVTKHAGLTYAMGDKAITALQNALKDQS